MSETTEHHDKPSKDPKGTAVDAPRPQRSWRRWIVPALALCVSIVAGLSLYQNLKNDTWAYYTDDQGLQADAEEGRQRMVLWEDPKLHVIDLSSERDKLSADAENAKAPEHVEAAFSPDGSTMVLTYTTDSEDAGPNTDFYLSTWNGLTWSRPAPMEVLNSPHDERGAAFSADGRHLYFASDKPGGTGGFDIYAAHRGEKGDWSVAEPLGSTINSAGNETGPALSNDNTRLFFTSDRSANGGGVHDIYVAQRVPAEETERPDPSAQVSVPAYRQAVPVSEINSTGDDIEAALSDRGGYIFIASDRNRNDKSRYQLYLSRVVDG